MVGQNYDIWLNSGIRIYCAARCYFAVLWCSRNRPTQSDIGFLVITIGCIQMKEDITGIWLMLLIHGTFLRDDAEGRLFFIWIALFTYCTNDWHAGLFSLRLFHHLICPLRIGNVYDGYSYQHNWLQVSCNAFALATINYLFCYFFAFLGMDVWRVSRCSRNVDRRVEWQLLWILWTLRVLRKLIILSTRWETGTYAPITMSQELFPVQLEAWMIACP